MNTVLIIWFSHAQLVYMIAQTNQTYFSLVESRSTWSAEHLPWFWFRVFVIVRIISFFLLMEAVEVIIQNKNVQNDETPVPQFIVTILRFHSCSKHRSTESFNHFCIFGVVLHIICCVIFLVVIATFKIDNSITKTFLKTLQL